MTRIAEEQKIAMPPLEDDLYIYDIGFDSLAFAILVVRLEDDLGIDPFAVSDDAAFPSTFGDFVQVYEKAGLQGRLTSSGVYLREE